MHRRSNEYGSCKKVDRGFCRNLVPTVFGARIDRGNDEIFATELIVSITDPIFDGGRHGLDQ
jgi:hypothetical protein